MIDAASPNPGNQARRAPLRSGVVYDPIPTMKTAKRRITPDSTAVPRTIPAHSEISSFAESIWRQRGCPHGVDDEIWLEAERQLCRVPARKVSVAIETGHLVDTSPFSGNRESGSVMAELEDLFPGPSGRETTSL
jgi:hypothetical protein